MSRTLIVTDSTARFPTRGFLDRYSVSIAPLRIHRGQNSVVESIKMSSADVEPLFIGHDTLAIADPPTVENFIQIYSTLHQQTDQILSIHTSSQINPIIANAQAASQHAS